VLLNASSAVTVKLKAIPDVTDAAR